MKKILVIGSLNLDMVTQVRHIPVVGETIIGGELEQNPGGKGANQTYMAARLGAPVAMLGAVGDDAGADILIKSLSGAGADVSRLLRKKGKNTGMAMICVDTEGNNSIIVIPGANAAFTKADIDGNMDLIEKSDIIVLQMEIPVETVAYAALKAKGCGKYVILDPAPAPEDFPADLYPLVDVLKPNETELSILTGLAHADIHLGRAVEILRSRGALNVLVTLGEKGVYLNGIECGEVQIPAKKVKVVDTTAAGDAFSAALAVGLAGGSSLEEAARYAVEIAALAVTRKGAQSF